jgi:hypothetical protein
VLRAARTGVFRGSRWCGAPNTWAAGPPAGESCRGQWGDRHVHKGHAATPPLCPAAVWVGHKPCEGE